MSGQVKGTRTLTISIDPQGKVEVNGPLHDKAGCYALLELAKDLIREHHQPVIQRPNSLRPIR